MTLTIFSFLYLSIVCLVFFNIRESLRIGTLAVASVLYVLSLNQRAAVFVLVVSVLTWGCGLLTGFLLKKERRVAAGFSAALPIIAAIALLALFKYGPDLKSEGIMDFPFKVVMPIGFSFYIFQVISYLTDIYKGTVEADRSWLKVFIYLCWFPKFVSGPIERKAAFDTQIQNVNKVSFLHTVPWGKVFSYILTGCFYKIVIADRLGIYVKKLFEEYGDYGSLWLIIGAFMYSFQIYCDFAGYSYAAIGISEIFGIELTENFMMPYYSANITEFWRRWHRSLSSWLKDYIYIPLGGNRRGEFRKILNTLIVFLVCGMWHGSGTGFLVWGMLHGVFSALDSILRKNNIRVFRRGFSGRVTTFLMVTLAWIFFRLEDAEKGVGYINRMFTAGRGPTGFMECYTEFGLGTIETAVIIGVLFIMLVMEFWAYKHKRPVPCLFSERNYVVKCISFILLAFVVIIFGIYGLDYNASKMIYMEF